MTTQIVFGLKVSAAQILDMDGSHLRNLPRPLARIVL